MTVGAGDTGVVPYDPTIYLGAAAHYRYGRPPYSPELEAVLTREAGLDGTGRLLDGGCGPGVLTVRLAHLFGQAVGLDPDAGMLAEGRRAAREGGAGNIRWVQGLAEDLPAVAPGPYRLVTFGQSFHWTDEQSVAEAVYDMLEPGGALALIVHTVTGRPRPPSPGVPAIPHDEIKALVRKYLGSTQRAGQGTAPRRAHRFEDVLTGTRFGVPRQFFAPGIPDLLRDSESVLSGYFSLSSSAPHLFGDRRDDFAAEVRALLADRSPEGVFWDWPGDTEVVMARKPGPGVRLSGAGGEDAGHWRAEGESLGAQVGEAGLCQQALDLAGGVAGRVRRGSGAAGLGGDGDAPARREPPAQFGESVGRRGPEPEGVDGEDGVEGAV
ncbi:MAG TPA: class I SAM-dependent methyltransferase [Streptosporangiaceae bacterium]|nr:class I SAM-dependent methyltransferase [Streptosporangiaceae bacterium]